MFKNARKGAVISFAGIAVPFIVSIGASRALYDFLMSPEDQAKTPYPSFLIFTGVAMSITAFPVLARILSERNMVHTDVGQIVISSAAVDDAIAWALLLVVGKNARRSD
jgi:Kef-type K+ transport system membrane component KefB